MKHRRLLEPAWFVPTVLSLVLLNGCSTPDPLPKSESKDRAFILYWPPDQSGRLRLAVKDNIDIKGVATTAGSAYLAKLNRPAKRDAACMEIARERNVQLVGKTNLTEFALGTSGMNDYFGTPRNPADRSRIPGGSSSGSAVAVGRHRADVAFGTDTAGSVRVPAACCGVLGLKTTFGLVPLRGVVPVSPTNLDTVGPMAADVPNLVKGMGLLQRGFEGDYRRAVAAKPSARNIRIGRLYMDGTDRRIDRAIDEMLAARHFQVVPLSAAFKDKWLNAKKNGSAIAMADGWVYDQQYLGQHGVSPVTAATIRVGRLQFKTAYTKAIAEREAWRGELRRVFRKVDFIALPTLSKSPPEIRILARTAFLEESVLASQNTVAVNYAGNPAIAVPIPPASGRRQKVPPSLQLVGPPRSEAGLLNAARLIEGVHDEGTPPG